MKGNANSNSSNTTKPIFLDPLLQEVTKGAIYLCLRMFLLMNDNKEHLVNKGIFSLQGGR